MAGKEIVSFDNASLIDQPMEARTLANSPNTHMADEHVMEEVHALIVEPLVVAPSIVCNGAPNPQLDRLGAVTPRAPVRRCAPYHHSRARNQGLGGRAILRGWPR